MPIPCRGLSARPTDCVRSAAAIFAVLLAAVAPAAGDISELARAGDSFVLQENGQRTWSVGNDAVTFKLGLTSNGTLNTLGLGRTGYEGEWKPGTSADLSFLTGSRRLTPGQGTFAFTEARASADGDTVRLELVFEDSTSMIRVTRNYACTAG